MKYYKNLLFSLFLLILLINYINSELQIKFNKYYSLNIESFSLNIPNFVNYFVDNIFSTEILIGDPSQKMIGFLNTDQSAFYLTNKTCPLKRFFYNEKSNTYKFKEQVNNKYYTIFRFSESLLFDNITNSESNKCNIDNYEIFTETELKYTLCFIIGTKLNSFGEEIKDNLLTRLHENKYIKSYYFTFDINPIKEDELIYSFDLNIDENKNDYIFIKTSSYNYKNKKYLTWGLNFEKILFNNDTLYENELRAEFSINLGCIIASSSFREEFNKFLRKNNIMENLIQYSQKYYIYSFNEDDDEDISAKLQNFTLDFYHKELNYHFILNYKDLFYTKYDKIYCLIIFSLKENNFWKFGLPFFKKYKFIYNQDSKLIGFLNNQKNNTIDNNKDNNNINNNQKKYFKINEKIIILVIVLFIFILLSMIFFGILIGKKLYKVRKNKTNELLELYYYNSKSDKNN